MKRKKNVVKKEVKTKSCLVCYGYGLWAIGDACPMGPMDAREGLPTQKCPTCGANANPMRKSTQIGK